MLKRKLPINLIDKAEKKAKRATEWKHAAREMQATDDGRGMTINGLLVLRNGELAAACFSYPSSTNQRPSAAVPYSVQLCSAYEERPDLVIETGFSQGPSSHQVFGDDKFLIDAFRTAPDGSLITLLMSPIEKSHRSRPKKCDAPDAWIDGENRTWKYEPMAQHYYREASEGFTCGQKYQFIPHERYKEQVKRDLLPLVAK
jgi:hypothetical protein